MLFRAVSILLLAALPLFAEDVSVVDFGGQAVGDETSSDSAEDARVDADETEEAGMSAADYFLWPLSHIVQPALNALVFPFSAPIHYAVKNHVIEKGVEMVTFGPKRNIFIYPTFNLKPGSRTMVGVDYRHRNMILQKDYFVASGALFVNSDMKFSTRYSKRNVLGSDFVVGGRFDIAMDRDAGFSIPRSLTLFDKGEDFTYTDSSYSVQLRVGHPIHLIPNLGGQAEVSFESRRYNYPDVEDSILTNHPLFNPYDRGMYQNYIQVPFKLSLIYDNTDAPFVPTRGSRISLGWGYSKVFDYTGENTTGKSNELNHDFCSLDFVAQHYFYLGRDSSQYGLSAAEAREFRKFYTDFSWDETLRLWRPENIRNTLLNRRVLAVQFRLRQIWERERGGAPFRAFPTASGTFPLRGYTGRFTDYAVKGISVEYRWPIDRYVDGVVFDEYVMYGRTWHTVDGDKLLNSWGFGVRVRKPDLYLFRVQVGFHGLQGISLICTIAPEFQ